MKTINFNDVKCMFSTKHGFLTSEFIIKPCITKIIEFVNSNIINGNDIHCFDDESEAEVEYYQMRLDNSMTFITKSKQIDNKDYPFH